MIMIPALAIPLLIAGANKLVQSLQKKQSVELVRVAATEESRAAFRDLVFRWFADGPVARSLRMAGSPILQALLQPEHRAALDAIPRRRLHGCGRLRGAGSWDVAAKARSEVDEADFDAAPEVDFEVPAESLRAGLDFYEVALKGFGLVEFVDPATLATPPGEPLAAQLSPALRDLPHAAQAAAAIKAREIHGYLFVPPAVAGVREDIGRRVELALLHDSTIRLSEEADDRFYAVTGELRASVVAARLAQEGLPPELLEPLALARGADIASDSEKVFYLIGSILPYVLIAFAFLGGMYPAIDLAAGEKERGTLGDARPLARHTHGDRAREVPRHPDLVPDRLLPRGRLDRALGALHRARRAAPTGSTSTCRSPRWCPWRCSRCRRAPPSRGSSWRSRSTRAPSRRRRATSRRCSSS